MASMQTLPRTPLLTSFLLTLTLSACSGGSDNPGSTPGETSTAVSGRVADGICVRLYDEEDFDERSDFTDPEILRSNLAGVVLQMEHLGGSAEDLERFRSDWAELFQELADEECQS